MGIYNNYISAVAIPILEPKLSFLYSVDIILFDICLYSDRFSFTCATVELSNFKLTVRI